jgi:hypothetical protein
VVVERTSLPRGGLRSHGQALSGSVAGGLGRDARRPHGAVGWVGRTSSLDSSALLLCWRCSFLDLRSRRFCSFAVIEDSARAGNRRSGLLSALCAHTKAPYRTDLLGNAAGA